MDYFNIPLTHGKYFKILMKSNFFKKDLSRDDIMSFADTITKAYQSTIDI